LFTTALKSTASGLKRKAYLNHPLLQYLEMWGLKVKFCSVTDGAL